MILYKYYSLTKLQLDSIKKNRIYFSLPSAFNDPFESYYIIDDDRLEEDSRELLSYLNFKLSRDDYQITCFSEKYDSLLMWAHYADSHRGFCVGYEFEEDEVGLYKMNYSKEIPKIHESLMANNISPYINKSSDWEYEHEWRLISSIVSPFKKFIFDETIEIKYKGGRCNTFRGFVEKKPQIVYFGCNAEIYNKSVKLELDEDNKRQLYRELKQYLNDNNINYEILAISTTLFKLINIEEI